ncbi:MAG: sulfotransferase domain-containing protein [Chloroflexota bacterium]
MIVLSVGMPRAGSGWHYNLVHDLVVVSGGKDARQIRKRFLLTPILTEVNCNIGALTRKRVYPLMVPSLLGNTFAIKSHAGPRPWVDNLIAQKKIKPIYIYRDPRAALLSAYEYGQRAVANNRPNAFSHLETIEKAIVYMQGYIEISKAWLANSDTLHVRYEDFLSNYPDEVNRLIIYLGISGQGSGFAEVIEQYKPGQAQLGEKGLHFSKGQPQRFRQVLTQDQLKQCEKVFGNYLDLVGYER